MKAGRELDALVAEHVMGGMEQYRETYWYDGVKYHRVKKSTKYLVPAFSTEISDAWQVVEKMRSEEVRWEIILPGHEVWAWLVPDDNYIGKHDYVSGTAAAAPLAICLAALKAVGYEIPS